MYHKPDLNRAWRRTFWHVYDHLGLVLVASILWLVSSFTILLIPAATTSIFYVAYLIVQDKPVSIKNFFLALPKYFLKSTFHVSLLCGAVLLFIFNMMFYLGHLGIPGMILTGISFWICLLTVMAMIYVFPLLCRDKKWREILRYSFLLVLDNPGITLQLLIYLIILICLGIVLPIIGIGILAVFFQNAFLEIISRYNPDIEITEPRRKFRELWKIWDFS